MYEKLKLLDAILLHLKDTTDKDPILLETVLLDWKPEISERERNGIPKKLHKDGMIENILVPLDNRIEKLRGYTCQFITYDGLMLLEQGGYEEKQTKEDRVKNLDLLTKKFVLVTGLFAIASAIVAGLTFYLNYQNYQLNVKSYEKKTNILVNPAIYIDTRDTLTKEKESTTILP